MLSSKDLIEDRVRWWVFRAQGSKSIESSCVHRVDTQGAVRVCPDATRLHRIDHPVSVRRCWLFPGPVGRDRKSTGSKCHHIDLMTLALVPCRRPPGGPLPTRARDHHDHPAFEREASGPGRCGNWVACARTDSASCVSASTQRCEGLPRWDARFAICGKSPMTSSLCWLGSGVRRGPRNFWPRGLPRVRTASAKTCTKAQWSPRARVLADAMLLEHEFVCPRLVME